jgi:hypothetical protein
MAAQSVKRRASLASCLDDRGTSEVLRSRRICGPTHFNGS